MADDALLGRLAALPCWQGKVSLQPLKGGLSNLAFLAEDRGEKFVVRCGGDIPVHHVFRDRERAASRAAFEAGLSPEVIHVEPGITVLRFIEGRVLGEADMAVNLDRLVPLLKTCHGEVGRRLRGPPNMFWIFHVIREYVRAANADPKYLALADELERRQVPLPIVFGHHDLLPANLIDDGRRLWLIDWEYGSFGTPLFDLANMSCHGRFAPEQDERLLAAYFGPPVGRDLKIAFTAMKIASELREALWALVSDIHLRTPGIDYQGYAREHFQRFEELMSA
jgi:thiamine kinase-like enzyme